MNGDNPIEELWRIREELSAEEGYDVGRLFDRLREEQERYADRLVRAVPFAQAAGESALVREDPPA